MPTLSSCYFCGTALDAPIESYPVVPEGIPTDSQQTVALCPTCHRKHHALLEYVLDAVDEVDADEATVDEYDDLDAGTATVDADEATEEETTAAEPEPAVESETAEVNEEATAGVTGTDQQTAAEEEPEPKPDAADEADPEPDEDDTETTASEDQDTEDGAPEEAASEESADGDDTDDSGGRPAILSTPAAKKAIRLLQNREFPVERAEFQDLASSAYDIPPQDCEDVLDALIEEGYIGEKKGKLVRED